MVADDFVPFDWLAAVQELIDCPRNTGERCIVALTAHMTKKMAERLADPAPSSLCFCTERSSVHVHCPCEECRGKAVHYKTQERHLSALKLLQQENGEFIHCLDHITNSR